MLAIAVALAGCRSGADDEPGSDAPGTVPSTTTTAAPVPSTSPSTTLGYRSLGEEVAVSESVLGPVTWRHASSIPGELVLTGDLPGPMHQWAYDWLVRYENAHEVTGACFEIYEEGAGYLGLGPCPNDWLPEASWDALANRTWYIGWGAIEPVWIWFREAWFSPDGEAWGQMTQTFPDSTAVVTAEPWSVAERDGRWVVIGATGISGDADIPWLIVPKGAQPAAWVSDDLATWEPVMADFGKEGTDTRLTSVVAGGAGWVIFGIRGSQEPPRTAQWVAWASTDGITWEELPMAGVYDDPCEPKRYEHCGLIKAHMLGDDIVAYAWTWPLEPDYERDLGLWPVAGWRLLVGSF